MTSRHLNVMSAAVLSALLAACASDYKPKLDIPDTFRGADQAPLAAGAANTGAGNAGSANAGSANVGSGNNNAGSANNAANANTNTNVADIGWWEQYNDPTLQKLIRMALEKNRDLRIAAATVEEYRALARIGVVQQLPQVSANVGGVRSQSSLVGPPPQALTQNDRVSNDLSGGVDVSYELDLWGRVRNLSKAAREDFFATQYAQNVTRMGLVADVATAYFSLLSLDRQLLAAQDAVGTREKFLQMTRAQFQHGAASALDVDSATASLEAARATVPDLERQITQQEDALQVLIGGVPGKIERPAFTADQTLPMPPDVPVGLPADVIRRRPDVQEAEAQVYAADARFRAARAAMLPSITLTGSFGSESAALSNFFTGAATTWALGLNAALSLINSDVNYYQVKVYRAREEEVALQYEKTVQTALQDVADALVARRKYAEVQVAQDAQVAALREAVRRSTLRYQAGYSSYFEVISAQQSLLDAELSQAQAYLNLATSAVQLYKALGGGWTQGDGGNGSGGDGKPVATTDGKDAPPASTASATPASAANSTAPADASGAAAQK